MQLCFEGRQFVAQGKAALLGDLAQIVVNRRLAPCPPVGLEPTADRVDLAGHVDVQSIEILAGSVAHRDSVFAPRSIGCSPREPGCRGQTTKTHLEEDVHFACDGDIALGVWEFTAPRLFIASLSPTARSTAIRRKTYPKTGG